LFVHHDHQDIVSKKIASMNCFEKKPNVGLNLSLSEFKY
jgi:hypothetical protein